MVNIHKIKFDFFAQPSIAMMKSAALKIASEKAKNLLKAKNLTDTLKISNNGNSIASNGNYSSHDGNFQD